MSKMANRAAAKAYMAERRQRENDEHERRKIAETLEFIRPFRSFLIGRAPDVLQKCLDDWIADLCGHRHYFDSGHMNSPKPQIWLKREREEKHAASSIG